MGCSSSLAMCVGVMLKESGYSKLSSVITPQIKTWHRVCLSAAAGQREGKGAVRDLAELQDCPY